MADPFVAEIRVMGFNFAPTGWAMCDGQLLPLSQNTALFALLGTSFGGNGKSNFGLPNLNGSFPIHQGQGQGLSERFLGESGGEQFVTLQQSEMPIHPHMVQALDAVGDNPIPVGNTLARYPGAYQQNTSANLGNMSPLAISVAGGDQPHNNFQPYLTLNYCIALQGVFPARP